MPRMAMRLLLSVWSATLTAGARPKDMSADLDFVEDADIPTESDSTRIGSVEIHSATPLQDKAGLDQRPYHQESNHVEIDSLTQLGAKVNSSRTSDVLEYDKWQCFRILSLLLHKDPMDPYNRPVGGIGALMWTQPETYRHMWKEIEPMGLISGLGYRLPIGRSATVPNEWTPLVTALKSAEAKARSMQEALTEFSEGIRRFPTDTSTGERADEHTKPENLLLPLTLCRPLWATSPQRSKTSSQDLEVSAEAKSIMDTYIVEGSTMSLTKALDSFNKQVQAAADQAYSNDKFKAYFVEAELPKKAQRFDRYGTGVTPMKLLNKLMRQAKNIPDDTLRELIEYCTQDGDEYKTEIDGVESSAPGHVDLLAATGLLETQPYVKLPTRMTKDWAPR
mmetsp:Transcript_32273/g.75826  ORF Transcript_32273/g.75826 Transcript_32273/m.75826 type:complete len:393 (-) Transcript_32273:51-1229(-)